MVEQGVGEAVRRGDRQGGGVDGGPAVLLRRRQRGRTDSREGKPGRRHPLRTGGAVDLTHHDFEQAKYAPGPWISSEAALQLGDIVYFGRGRDDVTHAAVYAGVFGGRRMIWDANTPFWIYPDGVHERTLESENSLGFVGAARVIAAAR